MLLGRANELARLTSALDAIGRHGDALVLRGEAGIGKSSLLQTALREAQARDLRVLRTAGVETESGLAFAGLHRLLHPVQDALDALEPLHRSALRAALGIGEEPAADPYLIGFATLALLSACAAERPVVVVADDLHWLDAASRDAILFMARRVAAEPIVVLAALRDGYEAEVGETQLPELAVRGLAPGAATALLDARAGDLQPAARRRLLDEAAGNPLALIELPSLATAEAAGTSAGEAPLPITTRLERRFAKRLGDVPPETRTLLLVAAADEASTVREICRAGALLLGAPADGTQLQPAVDARLIALEHGGVRFRHPLVRSAIYQAAPLERRQAAHAALTEVIDDPDRHAWHRSAATLGRDDEVAQEVAAMAGRAQRRGSILQASLLLARAADLSADVALRGERVPRAGELAFEVGRVDLVQRSVEAARGLALGARDAARTELLSEAFSDGVTGDVERVRSLVATARGVGETGLALELLKGASVRCWWSAMDAGTRAEVAEAVDGLEVGEADPRRLAILAMVAPFERCAEVIGHLPEAVAASAGDAPMLQLTGLASHAVGDHAGALSTLAGVADTLRAHGRLGLLAQVQSMAQWDAVMLGEWALAEAAATEGDRLARETAQPVWGAGITCGLAVVAAIRGDEERAEELLAEAESVIVPHALSDMHSVLLTARGIAALRAGRDAQAFALLAQVFDPRAPAFHYREQFGAVTYLAEAAVACGREDEARAVIDGLVTLAAASTAPALRANLASARATLAPAAARP